MQSTTSHTVAHVLGEITWLLSQTPTYKNLKIADLETMVMPAILLKQFRIYYSEGENKQPIAFAVWAYLSDEASATCLQRLRDKVPFVLPLKDWKSGENIWLIELVSPFATKENQLLEKLRSDLQSTMFGGKPYHYVGVGGDSSALDATDPKVMGQA